MSGIWSTLSGQRIWERITVILFIVCISLGVLFTFTHVVYADPNFNGVLDWGTVNYTAGPPVFGQNVSQTTFITATNGITSTRIGLTISGDTSDPGDTFQAFNVTTTQTGNVTDPYFRMGRNGADSTTVTTLTFEFASELYDVEFVLLDVDQCDTVPVPCYQDDVRVLGFNNGALVTPTLTAFNPLSVSVVDNRALGVDGGAFDGSTNGNVTVTFSSPIDGYIVFYGSTPAAQSADQHIGMTNVDYTCPSPLAVTLSSAHQAATPARTHRQPIAYAFFGLGAVTLLVLIDLRRRRPVPARLFETSGD